MIAGLVKGNTSGAGSWAVVSKVFCFVIYREFDSQEQCYWKKQQLNDENM